MAFARGNASSTDVFCFQEVLDNEHGVKSVGFPEGTEDLVSRFREALPGFVGYSAIPEKNERGLATFIKKGWTVEEMKDEYVYGSKNTMTDNKWSTIGINMLYTQISKAETYHIWNLHGAFVTPDKKDYPKTIEQSGNIAKIIAPVKGKRILCGDFNLDPETESIAMLERIPLRNLVKEYNVTSTRTRYYGLPARYADYIMPSAEVKVLDFGTIDYVASDHYPLRLDCE
jgi:endonuclease/exonuclease/phosphatase family metal-dependent hydrolase